MTDGAHSRKDGHLKLLLLTLSLGAFYAIGCMDQGGTVEYRKVAAAADCEGAEHTHALVDEDHDHAEGEDHDHAEGEDDEAAKTATATGTAAQTGTAAGSGTKTGTTVTTGAPTTGKPTQARPDCADAGHDEKEPHDHAHD